MNISWYAFSLLLVNSLCINKKAVYTVSAINTGPGKNMAKKILNNFV
jgi:hypothetical protein